MTPNLDTNHDSLIRHLDSPAAERFFAAPFERPAPPWPVRGALALFAIVGAMALAGVLIGGRVPESRPAALPTQRVYLSESPTAARCPRCGKFAAQGLARDDEPWQCDKCDARHGTLDSENPRDKTAREFKVTIPRVRVKGRGQ